MGFLLGFLKEHFEFQSRVTGIKCLELQNENLSQFHSKTPSSSPPAWKLRFSGPCAPRVRRPHVHLSGIRLTSQNKGGRKRSMFFNVCLS